jgi:hypothetical protein
MLTAYRIVYGFVLAVFLGNLVMTIYFGMNPPQVSALLVAAAVSLCCIFVLLVGFSHVRPAVFWGLVLLWEALFVWYAWFSPAAPFVPHEIHTFEANAAARESTAHYLKAGALFALLFAWFLSLPIARLRYHRRPAAHL